MNQLLQLYLSPRVQKPYGIAHLIISVLIVIYYANAIHDPSGTMDKLHRHCWVDPKKPEIPIKTLARNEQMLKSTQHDFIDMTVTFKDCMMLGIVIHSAIIL